MFNYINFNDALRHNDNITCINAGGKIINIRKGANYLQDGNIYYFYNGNYKKNNKIITKLIIIEDDDVDFVEITNNSICAFLYKNNKDNFGYSSTVSVEDESVYEQMMKHSRKKKKGSGGRSIVTNDITDYTQFGYRRRQTSRPETYYGMYWGMCDGKY